MTRTQALISIHLVAVFFGLCGILGELITASAAVITCTRAFFAVVFLALASPLVLGKNILTIKGASRHGWALFCSGCALAIHWASFFVSVKVGGIAVATLGFASFPAFITFIEWALLREKVSAAEWLRLLCVTIGLVLVTPAFTFADQGTEGLLWGLLSGATFGILAVINRKALITIDAFQVGAWQNAIVFVLLSFWALPELKAVTLESWGWILILGIVCTGLAHLLFISSLRQLHARTAGLIVSLEPVYAIAFAWVLFNQKPGLLTLAGGLLMIGAILSASLAARHNRTQ